jgi:hypothetical protein
MNTDLTTRRALLTALGTEIAAKSVIELTHSCLGHLSAPTQESFDAFVRPARNLYLAPSSRHPVHKPDCRYWNGDMFFSEDTEVSSTVRALSSNVQLTRHFGWQEGVKTVFMTFGTPKTNPVAAQIYSFPQELQRSMTTCHFRAQLPSRPEPAYENRPPQTDIELPVGIVRLPGQSVWYPRGFKEFRVQETAIYLNNGIRIATPRTIVSGGRKQLIGDLILVTKIPMDDSTLLSIQGLHGAGSRAASQLFTLAGKRSVEQTLNNVKRYSGWQALFEVSCEEIDGTLFGQEIKAIGQWPVRA